MVAPQRGGWRRSGGGAPGPPCQGSGLQLLGAGVVPVSKRIRLNLVDVGYPHDKPEGLALAPGGMLFVANDDDFAVAQEGGNLIQKILPPSGEPDFVSVWQIRFR